MMVEFKLVNFRQKWLNGLFQRGYECVQYALCKVCDLTDNTDHCFLLGLIVCSIVARCVSCATIKNV